MITERQIKAIKYLIIESRTIKSDFIKKMLIWLIDQTKGFTRSVKTRFKVKDMNGGIFTGSDCCPDMNVVLAAAGVGLQFSMSGQDRQDYYELYLTQEDYGHCEYGSYTTTPLELDMEEIGKISLNEDFYPHKENVGAPFAYLSEKLD